MKLARWSLDSGSDTLRTDKFKKISTMFAGFRNQKPRLFATLGSTTERGGQVTTATSGSSLWGRDVACVGDVVTYPDGRKSMIVDGAYFTPMSRTKPIALVGSRLSNGDRIVEAAVF
ncbi:PAAR domain-containing protein [Burkholderia thailandensis]|uniref:PAAR domain-containing protein n=1 Tax=Burkholderia thailandensis TaxID=57975 RepID=UPI000AE2F711|nr:PAAR domain-containing protein [Burkholderia thailandensis]